MTQLKDSPNQVADFTYGEPSESQVGWKLFNALFGDYPTQYRHVVAETVAKQHQYLDGVASISLGSLVERANSEGRKVRILEPGPSPKSLLQQGIQSSGFDLSDFEFTLVDRFPAMLPEKKENKVLASLEALPFPEAYFDVVFISSVLLYISDKPTAIREALRVLRPGGTLVMTELDSSIGAETLSSNVQTYELKDLQAANREKYPNESFAQKLDLAKRVVARFGPKFRYIVGSKVRNNLIVSGDQMSGFTKEQLADIVTQAAKDLSIEIDIEVARTYADSYHLLTAKKRAEV